MPDQPYLILAGVRRAVAARELGWSSIRAVVTAGASAGTVIDVPLVDLYSPKDRVSRSWQRGRYADIEAAMADPNTRDAVPDIEVVALRPERTKYRTRLLDVTLES